ncbi:MAG: hypothetical protein ABFS45_16810 [Pseudomonadota bacterium]
MHKGCRNLLTAFLLIFVIGVGGQIPRGQTTELPNIARADKQGIEGVNLVLRWAKPVEVRQALQGQELILLFNQPLDDAIHGVLSAPSLSVLVNKQEIGYDSLRLSLKNGVIANVETLARQVRIELSIPYGELPMPRTQAPEQDVSSMPVTLSRSEQIEQLENEQLYEFIRLGAYEQALPYLRRRASRYGGDWLYSYADAAKKSNRAEKLAELLITEIERDDLSPSEIEERVWVLIEELPITSVTFLHERALHDPAKWVDYYAHALGKVRDGDEQFVNFLDEALSSSDLSDADRRVLLAHLFNAGGRQQVRVHLEKIAESGAPGWVKGYGDLLYQMREDLGLQAFLSRRGRGQTVSIEERRDIFSTLLSFGNKSAALPVLQAIAANAAPDSDDVEELLFFWGPRPGAAQIEWLAERARKADLPAHRTAWLLHLIDSGGAAKVVELIESQFGTMSAELRRIQISALQTLGRDEALRSALRSAVAAGSDPTELTHYAEIAQQRNFLSLAEAAWRAVLTKEPGRARARRELGIMAFEQGRLAEAQAHLWSYLDNENEDFEAIYVLAETLRLQSRAGDAIQWYARALQRVRAANGDGVHAGLIEARVLSRLGESETSSAKFQLMLQKFPADRAEILAAYAQTLIDKRHYGEALDVLDTQ